MIIPNNILLSISLFAFSSWLTDAIAFAAVAETSVSDEVAGVGPVLSCEMPIVSSLITLDVQGCQLQEMTI